MTGRVKLWHDDVREPPDDTWTWARSNDAAKAVLAARPVEVASLDHDLGPGEEGYDLVKWMIETGNLPQRVIVHSWNPNGARRMANELRGHVPIFVRPYRL